MRRVGLALGLAVAALASGGCAVSLFSSEKVSASDAERIEKLEHRMDAVERALPPR